MKTWSLHMRRTAQAKLVLEWLITDTDKAKPELNSNNRRWLLGWRWWFFFFLRASAAMMKSMTWKAEFGVEKMDAMTADNDWRTHRIPHKCKDPVGVSPAHQTPPSLTRSEGGPRTEGREVEMTPLEEKTQGGEGETRQSSLGEREAEEEGWRGRRGEESSSEDKRRRIHTLRLEKRTGLERSPRWANPKFQ